MTLVANSQATWPAVDALGPEPIALICIGATEQHGPHLPIEMDTLIAGAVGAGVAASLDAPVLLFGPFPLGISQHHVGFPGTVTISAETLAAVVEAYIASCGRARISKIALFSGHGGNFEFLGDFCRRRRDRHPETRLSAYTDLQAMVNAGRRVVEDAGLGWPACDAHAGLLETSLALHLLGPSTVGDFRDVIGYNSAAPGWLDRFFSSGVRSLTDTGVVGDPRAATADLGRDILAAICASVAAQFADELELDLKERH
jgi:creatinine amidohydrolase